MRDNRSAVTIEKEKFSRQVKGGIFFGLANGLKAERMTLEKYIQSAWPVAQPSTAFINNWHIGAISEYFEAVITGQITRLIVNVYPRIGKSLLFSILGPTWAWTERPWMEMIFLSYSQRLATDFSRDRRLLVESHWYKERWGNLVKLSPDQNQKNEFENTARGGMYSTSVGGTLTGKGGDLIVIDDGIDPTRAESKSEREAAIRYVKDVVSTRLNDPRRGAIVEVSQRTHKHDISGTLLEQGNYVHLNLPAIAETKTIIDFPISKKQFVREEGSVLFPQRHTKEMIIRQMGDMTPRAARAQIQQKPSSEEAALFKRDCWMQYDLSPDEMAKQMDELILSWDMAFKATNDSDFVAGGVLGRKGPNFYVFNVVNKRMGFGASKDAVVQMAAAWPKAHRKIIEDKANGPAIIEELKKVLAGIEPYSPIDSKGARAQIVANYQQTKNIYLPNPLLPGCGWVKSFVDQCEEFNPNGDNAHDDMVDMLSQGFIFFLNKRSPSIFVYSENADDDGDDD